MSEKTMLEAIGEAKVAKTEATPVVEKKNKKPENREYKKSEKKPVDVIEKTIDVLSEPKPEDLKEVHAIDVKVVEIPEVKEAKEEVEEGIKPEVKPEIKKPVKKVSGKVISVSKLSYVVKTADGSAVLVTGKHNKKIGDKV